MSVQLNAVSKMVKIKKPVGQNASKGVRSRLTVKYSLLMICAVEHEEGILQ